MKPGANSAALHAAGKAEVVRRYKGLQNIEVIRIAKGTKVDDEIKRYQKNKDVEYAEPDYILSIGDTPTDPRFADGSLWGLSNTGQNGGVSGADIKAVQAWDIRHSSPNVIVAVIDTGIRYTHEDLAANMWRNAAEIAGNGVDDDGNGFIDDVYGMNAITNSGDPMDDHGHGTHCAGTIGAAGNNGLGVVGVTRSVQLMACKFLSSGGSGTTSDAIECVNYARLQGAHIMSNSWGGGAYSQALKDAIDAAGAAGILFIAAAGNESSNNDAVVRYPSGYDSDNIVSVAATTRTDALASFSNYGATKVDIGAPGLDIMSCWNSSNASYNTISGTSMATPHISGAFALMKARFPSESYQQLIARVYAAVDVIPALAGRCVSNGRLNLYNALGPDTTPPSVTINQSPTQADPTNLSPIIFNIVFSEDVNGFTSADVFLSGTAEATTASVSGSGSVYTVAVSGMTANGTVIATIPAGVAQDAIGNPNTASTSTDNTINYTLPVMLTWVGQGLNDNWTSVDNWVGGSPSSGDRLVFDGTSRLNPINNLPAGTPIGAITLNAGGFTLDGASIALYGDLLNNSGINTVSLDFLLAPNSRVVAGAGTELLLDGAINTSGNTLQLNNAGSLLIAGDVLGSGSLQSSGSGTVSVRSSLSYTGLTTVSAGTLRLESANALNASSGVTVSAGAAINLLGNNQQFRGLAGAGSITSTSPTGATLTLNTTSNTAFPGIIGGSLALTKSGSATLSLTGSNTYTGATQINGGILSVQSAQALGSTSSVAVATDATLELGSGISSGAAPVELNGGATNSGALKSIGGISSHSGLISLRATSTVRVDDGEFTLSNTISDAGGLVKTGPGTLILAGTNTYTGATSINAGTLQFNGSQTASPITLTSGTLSGTGTVGSVTGNGGIVRPGSTAIGRLTTGSLTLNTNSTLSIRINGPIAGVGYDQLRSSSVVLSNSVLNVSTSFNPALNDVFTIVDNTGGAAVVGTFAGMPEGSRVYFGGKPFLISYVGGTGNDVTLTAAANATELQDDFDPNTDLVQWTSNNGVASQNFTPNGTTASGNSLFFDGSVIRAATTQPLNVSAGGVIQFSLIFGSGTFPENADPGEDVVLEYSLDGGATFTIIATYGADSYIDWTRFQVSIPIAAQSTSTIFQWRQVLHSGTGFDHWALDNVWITDGYPPTITSISNQTTVVDTPRSNIPFTLSDLDTPIGSLTITATSSIQSLLPNANIVLGGTGTNRTISLTPAAGQRGNTLITIIVDDGKFQSTSSFTLTVIGPPRNVVVFDDGAYVDTVGGFNSESDTVQASLNSLGHIVTTFTGTTTTAWSNALVAKDVLLIPEQERASISLALNPSTILEIRNFVYNGKTVIIHADSFSYHNAFISNVFGLSYSNGTASNSVKQPGTANTEFADDPGSLGIPSATIALLPSSIGTANSMYGTSSGSIVAAIPYGSGLIVFMGWDWYNASPLGTVDGGWIQVLDSAVREVSRRPYISDIPNQALVEDTSSAAIAFQIADNDTPLDSLVLTASSTNTGLIPAPNIVIGGAGSARTVTLTPLPNANGSATITITVSDGTNSTSDTFVLTVTDDNTSPTISTITNKSGVEDIAIGPVAFTISDAQTPLDSLTLSATSSNTTLMPVSNITFGGSGGSRTVTLSPAANQIGSSTITLTVTDDGSPDVGGTTRSASTTFTVTYTDDNTSAPTISAITNRAGVEDIAIGPVSFTVFDSQTPLDALTLSATSTNTTLMPVSSIAFGGAGGSRTVTLTPAANQTGTSTITLTVTDDGSPDVGGATRSASTSFTVTFTDDNTSAPTISAISNRTGIEDIAIGPVPFTVFDSQTPLDSLTLSATSSNTTLMPVANITFGGSAGSRTVLLTPAPNQIGTATITLTVNDDGSPDVGGATRSASTSFAVTFTDDNTSPTISAVANQIGFEDVAIGPVAFTVSDGETQASLLTLSATSSNTTLMPVSNITFGGAGGSRTVTLTPAANQFGTATITLTVTDDGSPDVGGATRSASTSFTVSFSDDNTAPYITAISSQTGVEDSIIGPIAFTVSDGQTQADLLALSAASSNTTLIPVSNIVFGGSGSSRTVMLTPAPNQNGTATITLTVSDDGGPDVPGIIRTASTSFIVTVSDDNSAPVISTIQPQTTRIGLSCGPIPFNVSDLQTPASSLIVTATSSNTTLVPNANLILGGSGTQRTISATPAAGQSGTTTVTVTVSDNGAPDAGPPRSSSTTFVLDVATLGVSFRINSLLSTGSAVVDHDLLTGDDHGGIAISTDRVFVTGDSSTAHYALSNLTGGASVGQKHAALACDFQAGIAYVLANGSTPLATNGTVNSLIQLNSQTGALTATRIDLSTSITMAYGSGIFSGYGRIMFHNGSRVYNVALPSGVVTDLGAMPMPTHVSSEAWAFWGIAEYFNNAASLVYVSNSQTISRTTVPSGPTTTLALFSNLSDMASITFSPSNNRWYFHHEYSSQFGGSSETLGYASATWESQSGNFPIMTALSNQTMNEDTTLVLPFGVNDLDTPGSLTVVATSSSSTLFPAGSLVVAGTGTSRTISITPAANAFGSANVTLTVSDGINNVSTTFTVVVQDDNALPTLSVVSNLDVNIHDPLTLATVNVADNNTPAATLILQASSANKILLPDSDIILGGTGANRTIQIRPTSGLVGRTSITLTLTDDGAPDSVPYVAATTLTVTLHRGAAYVRSSIGAPFDTTNNEGVMDRVFGTGAWRDARFETVNATELFSARTSFIWIEGGNLGATEMAAFVAAHYDDISNWVDQGGTLFINAAPNEGINVNLGLGTKLIYPDSSSGLVAVKTAHPIFSGPYLPVSTSYSGAGSTGTLFGAGSIQLIANGSGRPVLTEKQIGAGCVLFGSLSAYTNVTPTTQSQNLRGNMVAYLAQKASRLLIEDCPQTIVPAAATFFTVRVQNLWGQDKADYTGTVRITCSDPAAELPADYTFKAADAGVATFTVRLRTAGMQSITVTDTLAPLLTATAANIQVLPNTAPKLQNIATTSILENQETILTGQISDPDSGQTFALEVNWGDGTETVSLPPGTTTFSLRHTYTDDNPTNTATDIIPVSLELTDEYGDIALSSTSVAVTNVAPVAIIENIPVTVQEGALIQLTSRVVDPGSADTFTYYWYVTYGGSIYAVSDKSFFTFTANDSGDFSVFLRVTDDDGGFGDASVTISVANVAPSAQIVAPANMVEGETVQMRAQVTDAGTADTHSYDWTIRKNGAIYLAANVPTFNFTPVDNGSYTVSLRVTDDDGGIVNASSTISVTNVAPVVQILGAPASAAEGSTVALTSQISDAGVIDTFTYSWVVTKNSLPYSSGSNATHDFLLDAQGTYVVALTVTDDDGGTSQTQVRTIVGTSVAPTAVINGAPASVNEGDLISLTSLVTHPTTNSFSYQWLVYMNGEPIAAGDTDAMNYRPDRPGVCDISLIVTCSNGLSDTASVSVLVANVAPAVVIVNPPVSVVEGSLVSLDCEVSDAGTLDGMTYTWIVTKNGVTYASSNSSKIAFTADDNAVFNVTITVQDIGDDVASTTTTIIATNVNPVVTVSGAPEILVLGQVVSLSASVDDPGSQDNPNLIWSLTINGQPSLTGSGSSFGFIFKGGTYDVTAVSTDKDGGTGAASVQLVGAALQISAPIVQPNPALVEQPIQFNIGTEAGGKSVNVVWSMGDGTVINGASGFHTYTTPGTYDVTVTISSDLMEQTRVITVTVEEPTLFLISKASVKLNFAKQNADALALSGELPVPSSVALAGQTVKLQVGSAEYSFILSSKLKAGDSAKAFKMSGKSASKKFAFSTKTQSLQTLLGDLGFTNSTISKDGVLISLPVRIHLGGVVYAANKTVKYTATQGKAGISK